jgi:UDP-N-acetylmuramate dehydrogenase
MVSAGLMALAALLKKELVQKFDARARFDEPMAHHTMFRTGGPADAFVTAEDEEEMMFLVRWLKKHGLPRLIIGGGTNLLVRDGGIRGVTIAMRKKLATIRQTGPHELSAMAGAGLASLCRTAIKKGLGGLNFAVGIPGTVGGAIRMNAGAWGRDMGAVVHCIRIVAPDGEILQKDKPDIRFAYRSLAFADETLNASSCVILEGRFTLTGQEPAALKKEADDLLTARKLSQPAGSASAGCFFKNPENHEPAGKLIELAGGKRLRKGDARVSEKHANFIVNQGRASAADVLRLKDMVQEAVYQKFNVFLEPEVQIVGED